MASEKYTPSSKEIKEAEEMMTSDEAKSSKEREENVKKDIYEYNRKERLYSESAEAYVDIRVGEKFESVGLLYEALLFYNKAKIDADRIRDISAWQIVRSLDGQISEKEIQNKYDSRKAAYDNIVATVDKKIKQIEKTNKEVVERVKKEQEEIRKNFAW